MGKKVSQSGAVDVEICERVTCSILDSVVGIVILSGGVRRAIRAAHFEVERPRGRLRGDEHFWEFLAMRSVVETP